MTGRTSLVAVLAASLILAISVDASAARSHGKRHVRPYKGIGFLPGYRELLADRRRAERGDIPYNYSYGGPGYYTSSGYGFYTYHRAGFWSYGGPGFYRGRWNGGGLGPCWTRTPIGPIWNCGR